MNMLMNFRNRLVANRQGQSLVVAIAVLFLLLFIAGIFIAMVGQNLTRAGRGSDVVGASSLAEAGIRFADSMLTTSDEGADWRPTGARVDPKDPDAGYINNGYVRFTLGNGRFLLKLTYPGGADNTALARCIKIESIGRVGLIEPGDPTSYTNSQPLRLRRAMVAYKPIGITDYMFYVTNKDKSPDPATFGVPVKASPEMPDNFMSEYVGPIRVNGDLQWVGNNRIYLNRGLAAGDYAANKLPIEFPKASRGDAVEVAGEITHWGGRDPANPSPNDTAVELEDPDREGGAPRPVFPSGDANFTVDPFQGGEPRPVYRDGSPTFDVNKKPRWIKRLEPPLMDVRNPQTGLSRYISLTKLSGPLGATGLGTGIYIDNTSEIQDRHGDLTSEWLDKSQGVNWKGSRYDPPGVTMIFYGKEAASNAAGDFMVLTRNDGKVFQNPDGSTSTERRYRFYIDPADGLAKYMLLDAAYEDIPETRSPFTGVIYAEGNIRVRGMLPQGIPLTVVSGGSIYVEGNIIKGDQASGIALLAKDYVCVNTTQFFRVTLPGNMQAARSDPTSLFYMMAEQGNGSLRGNFSFGLDPTAYKDPGSGNPRDVSLLVSHMKDSRQSCNVVMWTGTGVNSTPQGVFNYNYNNPTGFFTVPDEYTGRKVRQSFPLVMPGFGWPLATRPGYDTNYQIQTTGAGTTPPADLPVGYVSEAPYYLERIGAQPLDIRIEALMYAQEKCFFVIPGEWFNSDPNDTRANVDTDGVRYPNRTKLANGGLSVSEDFPFYGEPLDVRIWINGAIAENRTASTADVTEWCRKWGWTPEFIGPAGAKINGVHFNSTEDPNSAIGVRKHGIGLTFVYDGSLRGARNNAPLLPRLPVSPDLIFFGSSSG